MNLCIVTHTRPSLDVPWFEDSSPENRVMYDNIINMISGVIGDRFIIEPTAGVLVAVSRLTMTNEEFEFIDTMQLNPLGTQYNNYRAYLNYNEANGIISDWEFYDNI